MRYVIRHVTCSSTIRSQTKGLCSGLIEVSYMSYMTYIKPILVLPAKFSPKCKTLFLFGKYELAMHTLLDYSFLSCAGISVTRMVWRLPRMFTTGRSSLRSQRRSAAFFDSPVARKHTVSAAHRVA